MRVLRALQLPKAVLLEGSPGVGKTSLVAALAHAVGGFGLLSLPPCTMQLLYAEFMVRSCHERSQAIGGADLMYHYFLWQ